MEPLKPRDKVTQHMTRDGLTLDNQTTGESVNVSSRETEQEYTAQPEGAAEKILERADELHDRHKAKKAAKDAGLGAAGTVKGFRELSGIKGARNSYSGPSAKEF